MITNEHDNNLFFKWNNETHDNQWNWRSNKDNVASQNPPKATGKNKTRTAISTTHSDNRQSELERHLQGKQFWTQLKRHAWKQSCANTIENTCVEAIGREPKQYLQGKPLCTHNWRHMWESNRELKQHSQWKRTHQSNTRISTHTHAFNGMTICGISQHHHIHSISILVFFHTGSNDVPSHGITLLFRCC